MAFLDWADRREVERLRSRVNQLEAVVQELCRRAELDPGPLLQQGPVVSERVRRLAADGRRIEAIKTYRQETSAGLAEAKDVVDRL
ncbi:hypothetical protein [Auraticoccus monumenti]|uniref:Ribosomal protein L7/L12 C-terminal domain-containing protein n=1 Tax=Auraticoccus monumenti TaxID=675864 RepID=A0A1G6ZDV9_9ACTN|nr:hypothetical protein [Auraticoccus monumenti]SDE00397.1 hypothetical protein SAMN04489747_2253 [Auraticoccus monumenti]